MWSDLVEAAQDVNSPLPVIAQRLYNDDVRRCLGQLGGNGCGAGVQRWFRRNTGGELERIRA